MQLNRAFVYGDLVFETIKVSEGKPQLLSAHFARLQTSASLLKFEFNLTFAQFETAIVRSIEESRLMEARMRFTLFRNAVGLYLPESNQTDYHIQIMPFAASNAPLSLGLYTENYKPCTPLSSIKSGNALIYVMAALWAKENGWNDALLLNEHGNICEATSSNVFIINKDKKVYTPAISEGCVAGVMREHIIKRLETQGYTVHQGKISINDMKNADAAFVTNAINGIRNIIQFEDKKFESFYN